MPETPLQPTPTPTPVSTSSADEKAAAGFNKGILIAVVIAVIILIVGIVALTNMGGSEQYKGFIQKVESQTEELKAD